MNIKKKESFLKVFFKFLSEVKREVAQVVWSPRREVSMTTILVGVFAFIMSLYLIVVDRVIVFLLQSIMK